MATSARFALIILDQIIVHAERLVVDCQAFDGVPTTALLAAEQVVADLRHRRRALLEEMVLFPIGEC